MLDLIRKLINFSAIRPETVLGKALRFPFKAIPAGMHIPILQGPARGKKWVAKSFHHGCWLGTYEYEKQKVLARLTKRGDTVYDLGAHTGFYSLLASVLVGESGHVFSFEPSSAHLKVLRHHLQINLINNCTVFEAAVSRTSGTKQFDMAGRATDHLVSESEAGVPVRTVSLDDLITCGSLRPPNLIKCDIEGAEYDALLGAEQVLNQYRPPLLIATHTPAINKLCAEYLAAFHYRLESIHGIPTDQELVAVPAGP